MSKQINSRLVLTEVVEDAESIEKFAQLLLHVVVEQLHLEKKLKERKSMGQAKNRMTEMDELGMAVGTNSLICGDCVGGAVLESFVNENLSADQCTYCESKNDCRLVPLASFMVEII